MCIKGGPWNGHQQKGGKRSRRGQREVFSSSQAHRQPSLHRRHAKGKMALQSCPEVGKMDRMSYAQVKGCGCLERDMTWGRQSLKAAFPAAGNRPCTEGHLGGPHGVHPRSTMLASPENLCSSQLPTTHRTRQGTLDPPWASLSVHLLSVLLAACPASPPLPYVSALTWMTEMYSYQASPLLPFPLQNPCFCSSPSCPRQKSTQGALPLRALP